MDRWGPQIVRWRLEGMTWREISQRTGLKLQNAYVAWRRCKGTGQAA